MTSAIQTSKIPRYEKAPLEQNRFSRENLDLDLVPKSFDFCKLHGVCPLSTGTPFFSKTLKIMIKFKLS